MTTETNQRPDETPEPEDAAAAADGREAADPRAGDEADEEVRRAVPQDSETPLTSDDVSLVADLAEAATTVRHEIAKVVVGQARVVDHLLVSLFSRGHSVFIGVPGLAKTLLVSTLARVLSLSFSRVQFTPDLMPSDITGTDVLEEDKATGRRIFRFVPGPLFANIILADEINRTPPKTQAALLQAMQEREVTAGGATHVLPDPFLVFATQNPIEQEGTYPLPEAQLDRFMLSVDVDYPTEAEEAAIVKATTSDREAELTRVLSAERILAFQHLVRRVPISDRLASYAVRLVRATRPGGEAASDFTREWVEWGAGPRASQFLVLGAKARAALAGRFAVDEDDVLALALPVLRHRVVVNFRAEAERIGSDAIVERVLEQVKA